MRHWQDANWQVAILVLLVVATWPTCDASTAIQEPTLPESFRNPQLIELKSKNGLCPYLTRGNEKFLTGCWTCGLGHGVSNSTGKYVMECCPGFRRSDIQNPNGACAYVEPTWQSMPAHLRDGENEGTADMIEQFLVARSKDQKSPITLFTTHYGGDMNSGDIYFKSDPEKLMAKTVSDGRVYSRSFVNKKKIPLLSGSELKVTTYSNGLVFLECRAMLSPDHETQDGIVHILNGPVPDTGKHKTVMSRLSAIQEVSDFVADIPSDVKKKLSDAESTDWMTVLAPTNSAWGRLKQESGRESMAQLARNHILDKMICSGAITEKVSAVGPTEAGELIGMQLQKNNRFWVPTIVNACGKNIKMNAVDLMAGNGVVHVLDEAVIPIESQDLGEALQCLASNPINNVQTGVKEFADCGIQSVGKDSIILLPTNDAITKIQRSKDASVYNSDRCKVFRHHVLKSKSSDIGQQTLFNTQADSQVSSLYTRQRDKTTLFFNRAEVSNIKPVKFKDGTIYIVNSMNIPPTKSIIEVIAKEPNTEETVNKLKKTGFSSEIQKHSPNVVFLANQDHGWSTRLVERDYSSGQLNSLFKLHTIPNSVFGNPDDFVGRETVIKVDSLLNDRRGKPVQLSIKRFLDGTTLIGHESLPESEWSLVINWNLIGKEGNVWIIDWPMKCPPSAC